MGSCPDTDIDPLAQCFFVLISKIGLSGVKCSLLYVASVLQHGMAVVLLKIFSVGYSVFAFYIERSLDDVFSVVTQSTKCATLSSIFAALGIFLMSK